MNHNDEKDIERFRVPDDIASWWSVDLQPWWRDIDYLGHVTAAAYGTIYEESMARFVNERWGTSEAEYVVAHLAMSYLREIRMGETPIRVHVRCTSVEGSRFTCSMAITGPDGKVRNVARAQYAAWDSTARRSRVLSDRERTGLLAP